MINNDKLLFKKENSRHHWRRNKRCRWSDVECLLGARRWVRILLRYWRSNCSIQDLLIFCYHLLSDIFRSHNPRYPLKKITIRNMYTSIRQFCERYNIIMIAYTIE